MKTQNINLVEAMNFALAGHVVNFLSEKAESFSLKDGKLMIIVGPSLIKKNKTERMINARDFEWMKDEKFHAGDDRSIEGYYN